MIQQAINLYGPQREAAEALPALVCVTNLKHLTILSQILAESSEGDRERFEVYTKALLLWPLGAQYAIVTEGKGALAGPGNGLPMVTYAGSPKGLQAALVQNMAHLESLDCTSIAYMVVLDDGERELVEIFIDAQCEAGGAA